MVPSNLFETEKSEAFVWNVGNFEVCSGVRSVQVLVSLSAINFHESQLFETSMTQNLRCRPLRPSACVFAESELRVATNPRVLLVSGFVNSVCLEIHHILLVMTSIFQNTARRDINNSFVMDVATSFMCQVRNNAVKLL